MRKAFMCSLCHRGLIGGGLYLDPQAVTFRCQKLTIEKRFQKLVLPLAEIREVTWKQILFPVATFHMVSSEQYTFLLFNKGRFCKYYRQYSENPEA